jgi:GNAT superfamily N-acetyltransferase
MMDVIIRDATVNDLDMLLRFEQYLINEERVFDETIKLAGTFYYDFAEMLENTDVKLIVAEISDEIIGTGYARIKNSEHFLTHGKYAFLGFMYVLPKWRGKGINKNIIEMLKQWASSRKVSEIRLDVYYKNEAAIKAYRKAGFANHVLEMRLQV